MLNTLYIKLKKARKKRIAKLLRNNTKAFIGKRISRKTWAGRQIRLIAQMNQLDSKQMALL